MTVLYILYYILAYIQHNGDITLEKKTLFKFVSALTAGIKHN